MLSIHRIGSDSQNTNGEIKDVSNPGTDLVRPLERSAGNQGIDETRSAEDV